MYMKMTNVVHKRQNVVRNAAYVRKTLPINERWQCTHQAHGDECIIGEYLPY